ncbi:MAG TPA: sigma-70 family RNA polymerase sigma factor [Candidatus Saccharimonadia bacterium]
MDRQTVTGWRHAILSGNPNIRPSKEAQAAGREALVAYAVTDDPALKQELCGLLVRVYIHAAYSIAHKYAFYGPLKLELESIARLALMQAIVSFKVDRGPAAFYGLVKTVVRNEIARYFSQNSWKVKVPEPLKRDYVAIHKAANEFYTTHGRTPTAKELAKFVGLPVTRVEEVRQAAIEASSRLVKYDNYNEMQGADLADSLVGVKERGYLYVELIDALARLYALNERGFTILRLRFQEDLVDRKIAAQLGISEMHVSRLKRQALEQLRIMLSGHDLVVA